MINWSVLSCYRILEWNSENDVITDAQFGFKPGFSTIDAIFVLQSLINRTLDAHTEQFSLYCVQKVIFVYVHPLIMVTCLSSLMKMHTTV